MRESAICAAAAAAADTADTASRLYSNLPRTHLSLEGPDHLVPLRILHSAGEDGDLDLAREAVVLGLEPVAQGWVGLGWVRWNGMAWNWMGARGKRRATSNAARATRWRKDDAPRRDLLRRVVPSDEDDDAKGPVDLVQLRERRGQPLRTGSEMEEDRRRGQR